MFIKCFDFIIVEKRVASVEKVIASLICVVNLFICLCINLESKRPTKLIYILNLTLKFI